MHRIIGYVALFTLVASAAPLDGTTSATPTSTTANGATKTFCMNVQTYTAAPDGYQANIYSVNNVMEYPIIVNKGDTVVLDVKNYLNEPTSIHSHGIFQNGTNWYDGPTGVTQCAIPSNRNMTYTFTVPNQHGTYWWHSHYKAQYVKGLRGPLIVRDPENEPYTTMYDDEKIVMLTDWYHAKTPSDLMTPFLASSTGDEPLPDSGLINGKGRYNCTNVVDGTPCDPNAPREVINFTPGKRYRLRVINAGAQATFNFSIDGHRMQVISADGIDTQLTPIDILPISPGQRYSVIVTADAAPGNFWMRATIDPMSFAAFDPNVLDVNVLGIVSYTGSNADPTTTGPQPNAVMLDQYMLLPYVASPIPTVADTTLSFSFKFDNNAQNQSRAYVTVDGQFSNSTYDRPLNTTSLLQVASGVDLRGTGTNPVYINRFQTIDMIVYNEDTMIHPFHLHGYNFQVVGAGVLRGAEQPQLFPNGPYPERDAIAAPPCVAKGPDDCGDTKGYVIIRFYADNPGIWLFHCHIEWHMMQGLAMTFVVDEPTIRQRGVPSDVYGLCSADSN